MNILSKEALRTVRTNQVCRCRQRLRLSREGVPETDDKGKYRPFSGLADRMEKEPEGRRLEVLPPESSRMDDGIDVGDARYEPATERGQRDFQAALANDDFGTQDLPADVIARQRPVFRQEGDKRQSSPGVPGESTKPEELKPGKTATWQNKKGDTLTGELVKRQSKGGKHWFVKNAKG